MRRLACVAILLGLGSACGDNIEPSYDPWILEQLDAEHGIWIRTPEFSVPAGEEIQDCYFFQVPDLAGGADLMIDRTVLALNSGSHHMNVFRVGTLRDLQPANGVPIDLGGVSG